MRHIRQAMERRHCTMSSAVLRVAQKKNAVFMVRNLSIGFVLSG
jgi:Ser/Thr protein kinase RdoA (MazF antagonist)